MNCKQCNKELEKKKGRPRLLCADCRKEKNRLYSKEYMRGYNEKRRINKVQSA